MSHKKQIQKKWENAVRWGNEKYRKWFVQKEETVAGEWATPLELFEKNVRREQLDSYNQEKTNK